ncbi:MAG: hypothetical protein ACPG7F_17665 [Aggregatilineales bacterium]
MKMGMSEQAVRDYLGETNAYHIDSWGTGDYFYPCLHLMIDKYELILIGIHTDDFPEEDLPMQMGNGWFGQIYMMQLADISALLNHANIKYKLTSRTLIINIGVPTLKFHFTNKGLFSQIVCSSKFF